MATTRDGEPFADLFEPAAEADVAEVAAAVGRELRGWAVAAPPELARALVAAGGEARRHAITMVHLLDTLPPRPDTPYEVRPFAGVRAGDLVESVLAAYPPGHPDFREDESDPAAAEQRLAELIDGGVIGPVLDCSRVALCDGRVVGASIVTDMPGDPPFGGPWLAELFRIPGHAGAGAAMLAATLHAATGLSALGLAVTDGNPARGLYESYGFRPVAEFVNVQVP